MTIISIIGATTWGNTIGRLLANNGAIVNTWTRTESRARELTEEQLKLAESTYINKQVTFTEEIATAMRDAEVVVLGVPAQSLRQNIKQIKAVYLLIAAFLGIGIGGGGGGAIYWGKGLAWYCVQDSVKAVIMAETLKVKQELDTQRHNNMVQIYELLMDIPAIKEKAEEMKEKKKATNVILEALENGD